MAGGEKMMGNNDVTLHGAQLLGGPWFLLAVLWPPGSGEKKLEEKSSRYSQELGWEKGLTVANDDAGAADYWSS